MKETRIYLDGQLINICTNDFVLVCNLSTYINKYGSERITTKVIDMKGIDEEKMQWLKNLK